MYKGNKNMHQYWMDFSFIHQLFVLKCSNFYASPVHIYASTHSVHGSCIINIYVISRSTCIIICNMDYQHIYTMILGSNHYAKYNV